MRGAAPRFYPDDPLAVDNDRVIDVTDGAARSISTTTTTSSRTRSGRRAIGRTCGPSNVNTLDEVPDSSWFTNRIGTREMSIAELARGPDRDVRFGTAWTIVRGKNRGFHPGFRAIDRSDPTRDGVSARGRSAGAIPRWRRARKSSARRSTTPSGITPSTCISRRSIPRRSRSRPDATIKDANGRRPFVRNDLDEMLKNAARLPNGRIRVSAERLVRGADMGRFEYHGTRDDDPERHLSARAPARAARQPRVRRVAEP